MNARMLRKSCIIGILFAILTAGQASGGVISFFKDLFGGKEEFDRNKIGPCGDWRSTRPTGYVVGVSDAKNDRMAAILQAVRAAREQVAARIGTQVHVVGLDSTDMTSTGGGTLSRSLAEHVTDQAVSLSYPIAYFGVWEDNLETWYALVKFSPNSELRSLQDQRVIITATMNNSSLNETENQLLQQQLAGVDSKIGRLSPYSKERDQTLPFDPHNCAEKGGAHLSNIILEGHRDSEIMWMHPQPFRLRYFLGISDKVTSKEKGTAERQATLKAREQVATFLNASIQQQFFTAYHGDSGIGEGEIGGNVLRGSLLQEAAATVSNIDVRYTWSEEFEFTHHYRSTVLLEFDYYIWMSDILQREYDRLKAQLAATLAAGESEESPEVRKLRESVQIAENMLDRFMSGEAGAETIRK